MDAITETSQDHQYKGCLITQYLYKILKEDCGQYKAYLHTDHLGLVSQWFLQNPESHLSESFEVVRGDFMKLTTQFYQSMLNANGNLQGAKMA